MELTESEKADIKQSVRFVIKYTHRLSIEEYIRKYYPVRCRWVKQKGKMKAACVVCRLKMGLSFMLIT